MTKTEDRLARAADLTAKWIEALPPAELFDMAVRMSFRGSPESNYAIRDLVECFLPRDVVDRKLYVRVKNENTVTGNVIDDIRPADTNERIQYYRNWAIKNKLKVGVK